LYSGARGSEVGGRLWKQVARPAAVAVRDHALGEGKNTLYFPNVC